MQVDVILGSEIIWSCEKVWQKYGKAGMLHRVVASMIQLDSAEYSRRKDMHSTSYYW